MPRYTKAPIFCGHCGEHGRHSPESPYCEHFARDGTDQIWLSTVGALRRDRFHRDDRRHTKFYFQNPFSCPTHPLFSDVQRELNQTDPTFKFRLDSGGRAHFEILPENEEMFSTVHCDDIDPDMEKSFGDNISHAIEVVSYKADQMQNGFQRLAGTETQPDPLYVFQDDAHIALECAAAE
ncbi:hypothetical protein [Haloarcula sp. Atlit-47R]|uniref:hypothetical protein n=1 Tax=Haloarcula sp. Atlit-47R TaxID=2282132 RepID=UPI0011C47BDE|nr:hypothetical protein [Haloarcula sp. Atlit-47R]